METENETQSQIKKSKYVFCIFISLTLFFGVVYIFLHDFNTPTSLASPTSTSTTITTTPTTSTSFPALNTETLAPTVSPLPPFNLKDKIFSFSSSQSLSSSPSSSPSSSFSPSSSPFSISFTSQSQDQGKNNTEKKPVFLEAGNYVVLILGQSNAVGMTLDHDDSNPTTNTNINTNTNTNIDGKVVEEVVEKEEIVYTVYTGIPLNSPYWTEENQINLQYMDRMVAKNPIPYLGPDSLTVNSTNFGFYFAQQFKKWLKRTQPLQQHQQSTVWLLNAAYSGSSLQDSGPWGTWQPSIASPLNHYQNAIRFWNTAIQKFNLTPIVFLMEQGESDIQLYWKDHQLLQNPSYEEQLYGDKNNSLLSRLRKEVKSFSLNGNVIETELEQPLPFLLGTILPHLYKEPHQGGQYVEIAHRTIGDKVERARTVNLDELSWDKQYTEQNLYMQLELQNSTDSNDPQNFQTLHYSHQGQKKMGNLFWTRFLNDFLY